MLGSPHDPTGLIRPLSALRFDAAGGSFPTEWEGQKVPPPPGKSLLPAFATDGSVKHDALWWLHEGNRALRVGDWKLVKAASDADWELFDLASDRTESHDLAAKMPDKVKEMAAQWLKLQDEYFALAKRDAAR